MTAEFFADQVDVSRETLERLEIYARLIERWNPKINLVSRRTLDDLWNRHFLDSAQVFDAAPLNASTWADLGTGGGFPGLIVAIMAADVRPDLRVTCVESDSRKATFLRTVLRETGVSATVLNKRIEAVEPLAADVVSARALAPLPRLLDFADRHLAENGTALFSKGEGYEKEFQDALETWRFQVDKIPSRTNSEAVILRVGEIERA
ncbi:16S rRNA (guanine(527)-N(7))-methyltransferase RsmG [Maritimibacter dapengensis]|uniref:Ribosomal RNA small subunit methyltransferase G n=1 Tax=Maritimibacter dapengensis TaxID=2836868 RepID=A0ABS6T4A3_9RHOB|nr:16S rRNA (guanine(527)-N(7))-methyltransferase RsmG [Maritimibacter dapengensis]MBV7380076.1 16S rRNA (guanine(527)-N(7))-methyltransferase RsmG [Maritimibacter dapengensis]